ncbi:MAG TPA: heavy metal translocating P-type ATPase, partial [Coriobacteriia bacterium]|nr:heavy metal translocating P-type ATPase [Coriobacteriia bacterium]
MTKSVNQIPGVLFADVNFASGLMVLEYDTTVDPRAQAVGVVTGAGHLVEAVQGDDRPTAEPAWIVRHRAEVSVAASGALIVVGWLLGLADATTAAAVSYGAAILAGGTLVWRRAAASLMARTLDMNVLMTIAVSGAAALGEWGEGATVVFLFALGGLLEARSLARTRRSIRDLMALAPEQARIRRGGAEIMVPPAEVVPGETMLVRPGERVPLDGVIVSGASAFDESPVTGESVPRDRAGGDPVFAGSLNTTGLVEVRVTASAGETVLARIVHLVEVAQASRAPVQRFVDRFSRVYTPVVIAVAALLAFGVPALGQASGLWPGFESWQEWVYRALVLLVVSCPCALVVSTPVAIVSAIARASRNGVLVKGGAFLERAASVRAVLFDKTGTLTEGRPVLAETVTLAAESADDALAMAAALEAHSNHPLARAVVAAAEARWGAGGGEVADTR